MTDSKAQAQRPLRADAQRNYDRLVAEAQIVFAEKGAKVLLDEIADRAGVGVGTFYRHFPSREAILAAVAKNWTESVRTEATRLAASADENAADALHQWLNVLISQIQVYSGLVEALVPSMIDEDSPLYPSCSAIADAAQIVLDACQRQGAVREDLTTLELLQMVSGVIWVAENSGGTPTTERMLDLLLDGMLATHAHRENA